MAATSDSDGEHSGHVPLNHRLWDMLVNQAKARFRVYPSLPASKWIHTEYVHRGGQFGNTEKDDDRHDPHTKKLTREGKKELKQKKDSDTRVGTARGNNQQLSKRKVIL